MVIITLFREKQKLWIIIISKNEIYCLKHIIKPNMIHRIYVWGEIGVKQQFRRKKSRDFWKKIFEKRRKRILWPNLCPDPSPNNFYIKADVEYLGGKSFVL